MGDSTIIERITRDANLPELWDVLGRRLSPTDLQSLLLAVYERRAESRTPRQVLRQYCDNRFVQLATTDPRRLLMLDGLAFEMLPDGFEVLELAPVCPLGTSSAVAPVSQNKVLTTIRNTEVISDATNVLALECARRIADSPDRGAPSRAQIKCCASHRVLRSQFFDAPGVSPHFRLLSLVTAGRDAGSWQFETDALMEHVRYYLRLIEATRQIGFAPGAVRVNLTAFGSAFAQAMQERVIGPLAQEFPSVDFAFDPERTQGRGYYVTAGFHLYLSDADGNEHFLTDGGCTDWTQRLLSNKKERLFISGMGSERFVARFG